LTIPIFILSLPRSGSTLLQRILAVHSEVATAPEPWILLPLVAAVRVGGTYSDYGHSLCSNAMKDFFSGLPNGENEYYAAIRDYAVRLYTAAAGGNRYFVDKTPRYHLIASQIVDIFPEARFIFLFRNPMAILASVRRTWGLVHLSRVDLYAGLESLLKAATYADDRAHFVKYEDLAANPEIEIGRICSYLDITFDPRMVSDSCRIQIPEGSFGNPKGYSPSGTMQYSRIENRSISLWEEELTKNVVRKASARRYLDWIGPDRLSQMGYNYHEIRRCLQGQPVGTHELVSDIVEIFRGVISVVFETHIAREKWRALPDIHSIYTHR